MCKGLIGKKLGMTGLFLSEGQHVPVTVIQAGPCVVTQIKTIATDGYNALQLSFGEKKKSHVTRPLAGHFKKSGNQHFSFVREFPVDNPEEYSLGQPVSLALFEVGERVDVVGLTKGRGFSGVIKGTVSTAGKNPTAATAIEFRDPLDAAHGRPKSFAVKKCPVITVRSEKQLRI